MSLDQDREKLITEIQKNRLDKYETLKIIKKYRNSLEEIKIKSDDFRQKIANNSNALEKTKAMTEIVKIELEFSKAIDAAIKLEFELRDKIEKAASDKNDGVNVDIREIYKQMIELKEYRESIAV